MLALVALLIHLNSPIEYYIQLPVGSGDQTPLVPVGQVILWDCALPDGITVDPNCVGVTKFQTAIDSNVSWTDSGTTKSYKLPPLQPGMDHYFYVRACNTDGQCSDAGTLKFRIIAVIPKTPINIRLGPSSEN